MDILDLRTVNMVQYIKPLREGGSLPAIVKTDDDFLYVLKFRGAGQGINALIAELLGGELARAIGLNVPELVFINLDDSFSKTEPDEEIQDLLKFSIGLNLGLHYLSGSITFDPIATKIDALTASKIVLLDSLTSNIDRTAKNPNLLSWHNQIWVIDNGASFYFHHNWTTWENHLTRTFPQVKNHVLLPYASKLNEAAEIILKLLNKETIAKIITTIPEQWLIGEMDIFTPNQKKEAYTTYLNAKLAMMHTLIKEAENAR
ncbi:MAG: HipA family kinase [Flavobacteriaceae bacterium]